MTIKVLAASIDEFDQILAIKHCNVAGPTERKNDSEVENTLLYDNHDDYVVNEVND